MDQKILRKAISLLQKGRISANELQERFLLTEAEIVDVIIEINKLYIVEKSGRFLHIISKRNK